MSKFINLNVDTDKYDCIINLFNDTPFGYACTLIKESNNMKTIWIPHSTGKVYDIDSSIQTKDDYQINRVLFEQKIIKKINESKNKYVASTGMFIYNHLIEDYNLNKDKNKLLINGEILDTPNEYIDTKEMKEELDKLNGISKIILAFGRAEEYKNLDSTFRLGNKIGASPIVITQTYFDNQPIIKKYIKEKEKNSGILLVNKDFFLPQYILRNFNGTIIMLLPSKREFFGLIINEIRKLDRENILIVANNKGRLKEQITDGIDGLIVDLEEEEIAVKKIKKYLDNEVIKVMNFNSQKTLFEKYNMYENMKSFLKEIIDE